MNAPTVSVILPMYNEGEKIPHLLGAINSLGEHFSHYEWILASDGSTDGTPAKVEAWLSAHPSPAIHLVHSPDHIGKGAIVRKAATQCRGNYIAFTDGDMAYSLHQLPHFVAALEHTDLAIASRHFGKKRACSNMRGFVSTVYHAYATTMLGLNHTDLQAGLKMFRAEAAHRLFAKQRINGFAFDAELLFLAKKYGQRVQELPAKVQKTHSSHLNVWKIGVRSAMMFRDILRIRLYDVLRRY